MPERDAQKLKFVFSKNLNYYMDQNNLTIADLANSLALPFSTVADWVHGRKYPRMDKVQLIADFFGVLKSALTEEHISLPGNADLIDLSKYHNIPILGRIPAGTPLYAEQNIEGYTLIELDDGEEYFALRVEGDSMNAARIQDGDLLIVRRQPQVDDGEIAIVMVGDENATVKRFYHSNTTVTLMPQSTNPAHKPQVYDLKTTSVKVLGKVVQVKFSL